MRLNCSGQAHECGLRGVQWSRMCGKDQLFPNGEMMEAFIDFKLLEVLG